jgi:multidrug transporter EmrE-like cation transporter
MISSIAALCILGFIISQTGAYLLLKVAAQEAGMRMYMLFFLGTTVGFGSPVCMTMALKEASPNIIYAFCIGGSFFVLQFVSSILFKQSLSLMQWGGIMMVGSGLLVLHLTNVSGM